MLAGSVNKQLVAELSALGAPAIGLSGADSLILQASRYDAELGFVGRIERVNPFPLEELLRLGYLPVIAPIAIESDAREAQLLNTNADTAAGRDRGRARTPSDSSSSPTSQACSRATAGCLRGCPSPRHTRSSRPASPRGGMIPKLEAAVHAAGAGCATHIIGGTTPGALARIFSGEAVGTVVEAYEPCGARLPAGRHGDSSGRGASGASPSTT